MDLLPQPRRVRLAGGALAPSALSELHISAVLDSPEELALEAFRVLWEERTGRVLRMRRGPADGQARGILLRLDPGLRESIPNPLDPKHQAYRLRIGPERVELVARSGVGLLNGIRTLHQLSLWSAEEWPCTEIEDGPDFAIRGLSLDVSRGRIPTLGTWKEVVDVLAGLKINLLQLYIEHTFAFGFNPRIGQGCSPLEPGEIRELDAYCRGRRIELVPCIASFGHMGFILNLPEYRHLAEVEATRSWESMTWRERMHGLTLDPCNPESRTLLESMYDELAPLFSAPRVNVSGDETYDLGRGKNRDRAECEGVGRLYVEHLRWLHELCARHGKQMLYWGDIIKKFPELIRELPTDAIALHWGYEAETDYESTALFRQGGRQVWVCPGTSSWNRIINDLGTAEMNIRRFAEAGLRHGASGLLNTDWGDEGHFNMLAASWHPIYLGAALAWNASAPDAAEFDRRFSSLRWGDPEGRSLAALRGVLETSEVLRSWPLLAASIRETCGQAADAGRDRLQEWHRRSVAAAKLHQDIGSVRAESVLDARELAIACRMNALLARKLLLARALPDAGKPDAETASGLREFAVECQEAAREYERVWQARNRPERLGDILAVFSRLSAEALELAKVSA